MDLDMEEDRVLGRIKWDEGADANRGVKRQRQQWCECVLQQQQQIQ